MAKNPSGPIVPPGRFALGASPRTDDPAFQPPRDPLDDLSEVRSRAQVIHREIPDVNVQQGWTITDVRSALQDLVAGLFDAPDRRAHV